MRKPDKCCDVGTYECQVPMPIKMRRCEIDLCVADVVAALNAGSITTVASCCGHGSSPGDVILEDGRYLTVHKGKPTTGYHGSMGDLLRKICVQLEEDLREQACAMYPGGSPPSDWRPASLALTMVKGALELLATGGSDV